MLSTFIFTFILSLPNPISKFSDLKNLSKETNYFKEMKNNLIELAHTIFDLLNDTNKMKNISTEDREKIIDYIDDSLLWSYTAVKPKKIDFINVDFPAALGPVSK